MEPVFEDECSDAPVCQRLRNLPTFVSHRQPPEAATRSHDNGRAIGLTRLGQEGRERSGGNVSRHGVAPLAEPGLTGGLVINTARAELNGVWFGGSFERIDGARHTAFKHASGYVFSQSKSERDRGKDIADF